MKRLEINAAKGAVKALKLFGDEVRRLSARMQGTDLSPVSVRTVAEIQEHPCLLLSVSGARRAAFETRSDREHSVHSSS